MKPEGAIVEHAGKNHSGHPWPIGNGRGTKEQIEWPADFGSPASLA